MIHCCISSSVFVEAHSIDKGRGAYSGRKVSRAGEIVLSNQPLAWVLRYSYWGDRCCCCMCRPASLLRCSKCKTATYCSVNCQMNDWEQHKAECSKLKGILHQNHSFTTIDDILLLLRTFSKIKSLQQVCSTCDDGFVSCGNGHLDALSAPTECSQNENELFIEYAAKLCKKSLYEIRQILTKFRCNNFGIMDELLVCVGAGIYPRAAILNHSCQPTCVLRYSLLSGHAPLLQAVSLRPLDKGEEFTHSYTDCTLPTSLRKQYLLGTYGFECHCIRCTTPVTLRLPSRWLHTHIPTMVLKDSDHNTRDGSNTSTGSTSTGSGNDDKQCLGIESPLLLRELLRNIETVENNDISTVSTQSDALDSGIDIDRDIDTEMRYVDDLLSEIIREHSSQEEYELVTSQCNTTMEYIHTNQVPLHQELELLQSVYTSLRTLCGPFHTEVYKVRAALMTAYLENGETALAIDHCVYLVCFQCIALHGIPYHPLLALQLYTLGDLLAGENQTHTAKKIYQWTREILLVAYGENSDFVKRLNTALTNL
eukprot:gene8035-16466_t